VVSDRRRARDLALGGNLPHAFESAPAVAFVVLAGSYHVVKGGGAAALRGWGRRRGGHVVHFIIWIRRWRRRILAVNLIEWIWRRRRWVLVVDVLPVVVFFMVPLAFALGRERVAEKGPEIIILGL
jgi:hypothetical protein